jgi:hypothetical protein
MFQKGHFQALITHPTRIKIVLGILTLSSCMVWLFVLSPSIAWPPDLSSSSLSILGRDTWLPAGSSRLLRITSDQDMFAAGDEPVVSFSPGPITVNYVWPATVRDLTVSITVPPGTAPGYQDLSVSDGNSSQDLPNALRIVDAMIPPVSPAVLAPGASSILTLAPNPLYAGQTSFSLDLGPDVAVGPPALQPDGSLAAPVSVTNGAVPGTRSVHLAAGPYALSCDRGFAVDFGPLVSTFPITINGRFVETLFVKVPAGYMAGALAIGNSDNGIAEPDEMYVDGMNTLYVLNQMGEAYENNIPPPVISVFDLNPGNYGTLKGVFTNIDTSGLGGLLESGTMLPGLPGKLLVSFENYPPGFSGVSSVYAVDVQNGVSTLFYSNPDWNIDPIGSDVNGDLVIGHANYNVPCCTGEVSVVDREGNFRKTCKTAWQPDMARIDPLTGKFVINGPSGAGSETVDLTDCSEAIWSDGPGLDEGAFGPPGGDFGNHFFVPDLDALSTYVRTFVPVAWDDPDQTFPERNTIFASGFGEGDGLWFDRGGNHILVADNNASAVIDIERDPNYQPDAPVTSYQPSNLSFGNVIVGTSSAPQQVTLANTGNAPLTFASFMASEGFTQSNTCGSSIAAHADCTITVKYSPVTAGPAAGAITIVDSAAGAPESVPLTGNSVMLAVSPLSLNFDPLPVTSTSAAQSVVLTNAGSEAISLSGLTASPGFIETDNCGTSLARNSSCSADVRFAPQTAGGVAGSLEIRSDDPGGPQSVILSGIGQDFSLTATPLSASVSPGDTARYAVTITPQGHFAQPISLTCVGAPALATCKVTPSSVTPDGENPISSQVTVTTAAGSSNLPGGPGSSTPFSGPLLLSLCVFLISFALRQRLRTISVRRMALQLGVLVVAVLLCGSCGGSSGGSRGTPQGIYTLELSAASSNLTHSITLSLTVR